MSRLHKYNHAALHNDNHIDHTALHNDNHIGHTALHIDNHIDPTTLHIDNHIGHTTLHNYNRIDHTTGRGLDDWAEGELTVIEAKLLQCLTFNKTLRNVDLRMTDLSTEAATVMATALWDNSSITVGQ
jgi:hypothetical protein